MRPNSPFHDVITNHSFNKITRELLLLILVFYFMRKEKVLMDDLPTIKSETIKLKTLALYFHRLQLKGETSLGSSHPTKEN